LIPAVIHGQTISIGITRQGTPIEAQLAKHDDLSTKKTRVLVVGIDGAKETKAVVEQAREWLAGPYSKLRNWLLVSTIVCANPDGLAAGTPDKNASGGNPATGYPPKQGFYDSATDPEAAYLWRWIGMFGPDVVIVVRHGDELRYCFRGPENFTKPLAERYRDQLFELPANDLAAALPQVAACDVGTIPAIGIDLPTRVDNAYLESLLMTLAELKLPGMSPAREELLARSQRSSREVAEQLSKVYGHQLNQVAYIPALALVGRLRLGELTNDPAHRADVEKIVRSYFDGSKQLAPKSGSELAGHLIFAELAARTKGEERDRFTALARIAADKIFDADGMPLPLMPYHNEMSDAVFMAGPILAATGKLTGEQKYFDACARHLASMRKLCLRDDGIYRHSPLDEAAWGRGNGFPALGMAWVLRQFPADHPRRAELLAAFQKHVAALLKHQDADGCWHEVIDKPASYREFTATSMIGWAMLRGVKNGWLDKTTYQPAIDRAWQAIRLRIGRDGGLVDVCTGTGKQKSLRAYYDRPAILGRDDRGGAMGLLFATEILASQKGSQK
jgi:rhamnogalacturonyl hydrolase YesR